MNTIYAEQDHQPGERRDRSITQNIYNSDFFFKFFIQHLLTANQHWKKSAGRHPGYETTRTTVFISGGETPLVFVSLVPSKTVMTTPTQAISPDTGTAYISSEPQGAEVSLDSVFRGTTPLKVMWIEKGTHTIMITKEGFEPWQTEITVQNASNLSIDARLVLVVTTTMVSTISLATGFFGSLVMVYLMRRREE